MSANILSQHYAEQVQRLQDGLPGAIPEWLTSRRRAAAARFSEAGFPDPRQEEWKYTNVRPIANKPFVAAVTDAPVSEEALRAMGFEGLDAYRMVFVDGRLRAEFSDLADLPTGVTVQGLTETLASDPGP
ncbi:MAG: Fe-S cluster assembly protein SufD, partial [Thioalkalivibrio sp.]|nr:Fe-S cluster assembly protein SufD [Thioalkalivibrio sp.]